MMPLFDNHATGNAWDMALMHPPLLIAATNDPLRVVSRRQRPWDSLLARWRSLALDAQLAAGAPADDDRLRQVRARQLTSQRWRAKLAAGFDELLDRCREPAVNKLNRGVRAPVQHGQIGAAESDIRRLIRALRAEHPVAVRGVAAASLLLTDGTGPVYSPAAAARLPRVLRATIDQLDPATLLRIS